MDKGKALVEDQKASISEAVDAGKQAAHDKKEELTASVEADGDMDKNGRHVQPIRITQLASNHTASERTLRRR